MTMRVHIIGPNLLGQNEQFHVHAAGCADVHRSPVYRLHDADRRNAYEVTDRRDVIDFVYADQMAESGDTWESYEFDFKFFPCVDALPVLVPVQTDPELAHVTPDAETRDDTR